MDAEIKEVKSKSESDDSCNEDLKKTLGQTRKKINIFEDYRSLYANLLTVNDKVIKVELRHNVLDDILDKRFKSVDISKLCIKDCDWCAELKDNILINRVRPSEQKRLRSEKEIDHNHKEDFHDALKKPDLVSSDIPGRAGPLINPKCNCIPSSDNIKKLRGHPRFHELLKEIGELHSKKNHDYAGEEKPLNNLKEVEGMGMEAWVGVAVRISDKYTRMKNFIKNKKFEFKEESFVDTMMDMAVYALLCIVLFEEQLVRDKLKEAQEAIYDRNKQSKSITRCPVCNMKLKSAKNDGRFYCPNQSCTF